MVGHNESKERETEVSHGKNHRHRQPEGRRGQDHHLRQPGRRPEGAGPAGPGLRLRPPGQHHLRLWSGQDHRLPLHLRRPHRRRRLRPGHRPHPVGGRDPRQQGPGRRHRGDDRHRPPGVPAQGGPGALSGVLRLYLHRLPPLPGAPHPQRPVRRRHRHGPRPVRVLRPGGPQRPPLHHPHRQAVPEPVHRPGGGHPHHVRRPDQPVHAGGRGGQAPLPGQGVRHRHPPERPSL